MFLTPKEIAELTLKTQRKAQRAVLNFMGIDHKVRPDGSIAVLQSHVDAVFGAKIPGQSRAKKKVEPNWEAIA